MNVLVFDTETSNLHAADHFLARDNMVFNIGGLVFNLETEEVLKTFNFLIKEIWDDEDIMENFYFKERIEIFNYIDALPFAEVRKEIKQILSAYHIETIYAYNIGFDKRSVEDTCNFFKVYADSSKYELKDIYTMACDMLKRNKEAYSVYCTESDRFSEAGNRLTNAESVYGFLSGKYDYEEEHSALEDSKIECEILKSCLRYEKESNLVLLSKQMPQCWRWVQGD